jgi:hypothetical protein
MKTPWKTFIVALFGAYLLGYALLRGGNNGTFPVIHWNGPPTKGCGYTELQLPATTIHLPAAGAERHLKHAVYWAYFVPAQVDRLISGRRFWCKEPPNNILLFP